jgi:GR25 family glycosyltransferase involved in LPS biosynthesis
VTHFEDFFGGRLFVINLAKRTDRWEHCKRQFLRHGLTQVQRFEACVDPEPGRFDQNTGCTLSHRTLLDMQIANEWPRMLVLEDDFDIIFGDFHDRWSVYEKEIPADWDMLYLGGSYGEKPIARVSEHMIRAGRIMTTSSYGITLDAAKMLAPHIVGSGPIDNLYSDRHREMKTYIVSPRLIVQFPNYSDLQGRMMNNSASMLDCKLEADL